MTRLLIDVEDRLTINRFVGQHGATLVGNIWGYLLRIHRWRERARIVEHMFAEIRYLRSWGHVQTLVRLVDEPLDAIESSHELIRAASWPCVLDGFAAELGLWVELVEYDRIRVMKFNAHAKPGMIINNCFEPKKKHQHKKWI